MVVAAALSGAALPAGAGDGASGPASHMEQVQYGFGYSGPYRPYPPACPVGHHYVCFYGYGGYRHCGCQRDFLYGPGYGATVYPAPGFDLY
jgi:hypothetical protein